MATSRILNQGGNPFSAGAVILDSTPVTQYYLNQEAKKQAKEEALDKYYQDQVASISSKGLRSYDMNTFANKFKEFQNFYMQKKDAIKNPTKYGFEAAQEYNQRRQELMNLPSLSKAEQEKENELNKLLGDPTKRDLIDIDATEKALQLHRLPIGDERRQSLDLAKTPFLAKQLSPSELNSYYTGHLQRLGTSSTLGKAEDIGNYKQKRVLTEEYSPENLLKAAKQIKVEAQSNPSLRRTAREQFKFASDEEKNELANIYQKYFGKEMKDGEDVMAAQFIQRGLAAKKTKEQTEDNFGAKSALSTANSFAKMAANGSKSNPNETYDFLKKGTEVLQGGNADLANQYFSTWKASAKNEIGGNIGFQNVSYTPAGWIKIQYNAPITKNGVTVAVPTEVKLDPKDPQLLNKITGLHQQFTGSDVKVEKAAQKEARSSTKEVKETKTFVFPKGKTKF